MRLLLALGLVGGVTWIAYAFVPSECTPPTGDTEVFCNRLWTPALFAVTCGFLGLRRFVAVRAWSTARRGVGLVAAGAALMTFGNFMEYWVFFGWSHIGPDGWLRGTLWMSVLLGLAAVLLGSLATGVLLLIARAAPLASRVLGSLLVTVVSFSVFIGLLVVGLLAIATSLFGLVAATRLQRETATESA
jgi:hypothetical protein